LISEGPKPTTMYIIDKRFMGPNIIRKLKKNIAKSLEMEKN
jgi:hypothetical protein